MRLAVGWLLLLAGCDLLFQITEVKQIDADVVGPCEDPAPFGTTCRSLMLPVTNDTYLSAASPDTALGTRDAIKISRDEPGLFKFDTNGIAADSILTTASTPRRAPRQERAASNAQRRRLIRGACTG